MTHRIYKEDNALRAFLYLDSYIEEMDKIAKMLGISIDGLDEWHASLIIEDEIKMKYPNAEELANSEVFNDIVRGWTYNGFLDYIVDELDLGWNSACRATLEEIICGGKDGSKMVRYAKSAMMSFEEIENLIPKVVNSVKVDIRGIEVPTIPMRKTTDVTDLSVDEFIDVVDFQELRKRLNEMSDAELSEMLFPSI